jgi:hypothetical protein
MGVVESMGSDVAERGMTGNIFTPLNKKWFIMKKQKTQTDDQRNWFLNLTREDLEVVRRPAALFYEEKASRLAKRQVPRA